MLGNGFLIEYHDFAVRSWSQIIAVIAIGLHQIRSHSTFEGGLAFVKLCSITTCPS